METISAQPVAPVKLIRQRIQIGAFRKGLVERRIKDRHLWQPGAENISGGHNTLHVSGVVQRREIDAVFDAAQDLIGDQRRMREALTSVDYTMADSINIGNRFQSRDS